MPILYLCYQYFNGALNQDKTLSYECNRIGDKESDCNDNMEKILISCCINKDV